MNGELKLVFKYCITEKISINLGKTNYMVISFLRLIEVYVIYIILKVKVK